MISKDIKYVGVNDHQIDLFEGHYIVPNGIAYNSYVIEDEKIAVMDSVDAAFGDEWLCNIKAVSRCGKEEYHITTPFSRRLHFSCFCVPKPFLQTTEPYSGRCVKRTSFAFYQEQRLPQYLRLSVQSQTH